MTLIRTAIGTVLSLLLLTSCTASPTPTPATDTPTATVITPSAPATPSPEDLAAYFSAMASCDPKKQRAAAQDYAAPGSNAYAYAIEQAAVYQAYLDGGLSVTASELETTPDGFQLCWTDSAQSKTCNDFNNLTYTDGKLADFNAGGMPLAGRLSLGDGTAVPVGDMATATLIAAYVSIAGALYVIVEIRSNIDELRVAYTSYYRAPDGRQADVGQIIGPNYLNTDSLANFALVFNGAEFGGTLNLGGFNSEYDRVSASIPIG